MSNNMKSSENIKCYQGGRNLERRGKSDLQGVNAEIFVWQ